MAYSPLDLTNKTAVVTGGTTGIGLAISKALAQSGANVVPTGRRAEQVTAAVSEVQALGRRSLGSTLRRNGQSKSRALAAICLR